MNILQFCKNNSNYVGIINGTIVNYIKKSISIYELAINSIKEELKLSDYIKKNFTFDELDYNEIANNYSFTLPMMPHDLNHCFVSGFGLTHFNSVLLKYDANRGGRFADAQRVYLNGLDRGKPKDNEVGSRPGWFYKGNGHNLIKTGESLSVFNDSVHVGEEPELAFIYLIGKNKIPYRVGFCLGNELTDHGLEDDSAYYIAQSKFLSGAINSEICIGALPEKLLGTVEIFKNDEKKWSSDFCTGSSKMIHSLENLEYYYFRNNMNLNENDVHFLFLGVDRMSFSDGYTIEPDSEIVISSDTFKTKLVNTVRQVQSPIKSSVKTLY